MTLLAATTTTEVPRVVGDPIAGEVLVGSGVSLLLVIAAAAMVARRRMSRSG